MGGWPLVVGHRRSPDGARTVAAPLLTCAMEVGGAEEAYEVGPAETVTTLDLNVEALILLEVPVEEAKRAASPIILI